MDGETSDGLQLAPLGDESGEERGRLAARAYRPSRIEIDEALRHGWLEIWYQPKINLTNRAIVGAEALARIRHPELGVLLPKTFLPAVSDAGQVHLTEYAVRMALQHWSTFDAGGFNLRVSVNVTLGALQRLPLDAFVLKNRPAAKHWPGLTLELAEQEIAQDMALAQRLASELRISGLSTAVDDFGACRAAFSGLRERCFSEFKIDLGFVKHCAIDAAPAAVCHEVIDLAHRLDSVVVAEGIENGADLQALERLGCDLGQGILIAPPMPLQAFLELLRQHRGKPMLSTAVADVPSAKVARPSGIDQLV